MSVVAPAHGRETLAARATASARPDVYTQATSLIAAVAVVTVGSDVTVAFGASLAVPLAVILLPLWLPVLRTYWWVILLGALAALSVGSGLVLLELSSLDHQVNQAKAVQGIGLLASGIAAIALLLWARSLMPLHRVVVLYGVGALASMLVSGQLSWKFNLAIPTALVVLGLLERHRTGMLAAAAVLLVGVLAALDEGRSLFAACVLAATLTIWQLWPRARGRRQRPWRPALLVAGIASAVYLFTTALATSGTLGDTLQERSETQLESGSLLAGGRPEWAATRELVKLNPMGYGPGVVPNWEDRMAGRAGLVSVGVDVDDNRDAYMFGDQLELHSVVADLWARYGWVGVALAAAVVVALVRSLSFALAARRAPTYVVFAGIIALWFVLFGPLFSNWLDVTSALAFALAAAHAPTSGIDRTDGHRPPLPRAQEAVPSW